MTKLSVNINKIATLRNARGGNKPDVLKVAKDCESFGAQGITVHPRPDERHITYKDVISLKEVVKTELNIEGYPDKRFMEIIEKVRPEQATLVPDSPDVLTSNAGWDTLKHESLLIDLISQLKEYNVRCSLFVEPNNKIIDGARKIDSHRIELYTEHYASNYSRDRNQAIINYENSAEHAKNIGIGVNAGHDLDLANLKFLVDRIPFIEEVSIGHALICDALYYGLENTIRMYLRQLQ